VNSLDYIKGWKKLNMINKEGLHVSKELIPNNEAVAL
jgi:hypothetical protein